MLRLWDRCYPSLTEVERARAQIVLQGLRERLRPAIVRLVGTGPSSSAAVRTGTEGAGTVTICCNSWVRHPEAMTRMGAKIITAGDPIFHAGPSEYAREFRADATAWLRADPEHLLVTVSRDIGVYLAEFPVDVHDQITAVAFEPRLDPETFVPIESGRVQPFPNVLTLLMLPLAQLLRPAEVHLYGFDGGAQGAEEYWKYAAEANYSPELQQTVRDWHPEFFRLDYDEYRDAHSDHVALWLRHLADSGITARAGAPSNIPAIDAAFRTFVTPADTEGRTT